MIMVEIILTIIVVVAFILFIFVIFDHKFQLDMIKIDKAEEDISMYLQRKMGLLDRTRPIVKKELKKEDFLHQLDESFEEKSNFEIHDDLKKYYNELFKLVDENEKLLKSEAFVSILDDLNNNEEDIVGTIKFYNDTVVEFNHLLVSFPSRVVAWVKRYRKKAFYNNEKREIFEILNQK